jgi:hypothetical protein
VCGFDGTNFQLFGMLYKRITTQTSSVFIRIFSHGICVVIRYVISCRMCNFTQVLIIHHSKHTQCQTLQNFRAMKHL